MKNTSFNILSYDKAFIIDMDGVINHGKSLIHGAKQFVEKLKKGEFKFVIPYK